MALRPLATGLVLAGALTASACGPLTVPGSAAEPTPARGPVGPAQEGQR
ncbi:hypothetical protein OG749_46795 (plasmid) [Streptomyces nojiriensis]